MYSFGQFSVCITGGKQAQKLLTNQWQNFETSKSCSPPRVTLDIVEREFPFKDTFHSGWNAWSDCDYQRAAYVQDKKIVFALEYKAFTDKVSICAEQSTSHYFRVGTLYGLLLALCQNCIGLHGVTITCGDKTVILSAASGTGKTTLSRLLEENYNTHVINGDFALLSLNDKDVIFEPTPYCGSSGICLNQRIKINEIVFLDQSTDNRWRSISGREAMTRCLSNVFVPTWDEGLLQVVEGNIMRLLSSVKTSSFSFAPTKAAADIFVKELFDHQDIPKSLIKEEKRMDIKDLKFPTSQAEMDELRKSLRQEIAENDLDAVAGGNDDPRMKGKFDPPVPWICPGCGATIMIRQFMDGPKHMTKCPGNPYK